MLISFIIPGYNAEDTIERCLNSIVTQSWGEMSYEIIVIDDASTDDTVRVIEDYRTRLNIGNLTLLRQSQNHRQGAARNRGVKVAKGEYICFVDADDAVTEGIVHAIRMAKEKNADMIALHFALSNEHGSITSETQKLSFAEGIFFTGIEMQNKHSYWCSAPWGYIYKADFLRQVNYPFAEGVLFEDSDFVMAHLYYAQQMAYSPELGYIAYYREGSTIHSTSYKNVSDYLLLGLRMLVLYEKVMNNELIVKNEELQKFAEDVLEGACFNVAISCRRLIKLNSINEVHLFYERVDAMTDRKRICVDKRLRKYFWSIWTSICIGHKQFTITLLTFMIPIYRIIKKK